MQRLGKLAAFMLITQGSLERASKSLERDCKKEKKIKVPQVPGSKGFIIDPLG